MNPAMLVLDNKSSGYSALGGGDEEEGEEEESES